ncbi:hypothetical protein AGMMS4956_21610 [Bacteroidia bacterium]|nr:hypothetical protein AGMMS4956_21610 [Bacteroidia bacterium]
MTNEQYVAIAKDYMDGMGYGEQPFATFLHTDKNHLHLHIVSSRVDFNDPKYRKIDDYNEQWRSQCVGTIIEQKYGITQVLKEKLPTFLQKKVDNFFSQDKNIDAYFQHWRKDLNTKWLKEFEQENKPIKNEIALQVNDIVAAAMREKPRSVAQLKKLLEPQRVEIVEAINQKTGKKQGLLFVYHRQDVKDTTVEIAEKGIPSSKLPCFEKMPLMQQLFSNKQEHKAAKTYIYKQLAWIKEKAKDREELQKMLQKKDIASTWHENAGGIYGVSFTYKDVTLKGSQVGKDFTAEKLAAFLLLNSQQTALQQQQRAQQQQQRDAQQQSAGIGGSLAGTAGKASDDDDDDDEEEVDEVTGKRIRRKRNR